MQKGRGMGKAGKGEAKKRREEERATVGRGGRRESERS